MKGRGGGGRGSPERILPGLPECSGWLGEDDDVADAAGETTRGGGDEEEATGAATRSMRSEQHRRGGELARHSGMPPAPRRGKGGPHGAGRGGAQRESEPARSERRLVAPAAS